MSYAILLPHATPTALSDINLCSSASFQQWIMAREIYVTPRPIGGVEVSSIPLREIHPTAISQKLIAKCRKLQRDLELDRPACLSPGPLAAAGYDLALGDQNSGNIAVIATVIGANQDAYNSFIDARQKSSLAIIELIYPSADFGIWREINEEESPIDVETLTAFAISQADAFLSGSIGLLPKV